MKLVFGFEKETKNTYRFNELNEKGEVGSYEENLIGSLYIQKKFFSKKPEKVTVVLEVE